MLDLVTRRDGQSKTVSLAESAQAWGFLARCRNTSHERFFRDSRKDEEDERAAFLLARAMCGQCVVRRECLSYAMKVEAADEARMRKEDGPNVEAFPTAHRFRTGMFGGLTPRERVRAADEGWTLTEALLYSEGQLFGVVAEEAVS